MSNDSGVKTSGGWNEERLYVLRTLDDVKAEQKRLTEVAAAERAAILDKQTRDIQAAHDKIRKLELSKWTADTKNWLLTGFTGIALTAGFEIGKALLHRWKQ